jgi:hypothetical protein
VLNETPEALASEHGRPRLDAEIIVSNVFAGLSMSLDGFIAGPNVGIDNPLGDGGEKLQPWMYGLASWREPQGLTGGRTNEDSQVIDESGARSGAFVMGRRMFDTGRARGVTIRRSASRCSCSPIGRGRFSRKRVGRRSPS